MASTETTLTPSPDGDIHLLCGSPRSGKSTALQQLVEHARAAGSAPGGFVALGFFRDGRRAGFDLCLLDRDEVVPLCRATDTEPGPARVDLDAEGGPRVGWFRFDAAAIRRGLRALERAVDAPLVIVDEVGWLELAGGGWDRGVRQLVQRARGTVVLVVRDGLVDPVRQRYGLERATLHRTDDITALDARFVRQGRRT